MYLIWFAVLLIITSMIKNGVVISLGLLFLLLLNIYKKTNIIYTVGYLMVAIIYFFLISPQIIDVESNISGKVTDVSSYYYIVKTNQGLIKVDSSDIQVAKGNNVLLEVSKKDWDAKDNLNSFDYKKYFYSKKVFTQVVEIKVLSNDGKTSLLHKFENYISSFNGPFTSSYTKQLLLGIKDELVAETISQKQSLSILHLFALSGLHLSIMSKILEMVGIRKEWMKLLFLGSYLVMLGNIISLTRAYLMLLFKFIFKDKLSDIEIIALIAVVLCLYNPYIIMSLSFIFSMTISFFIIITKDTKHRFIYPSLAAIPIIISTQYSYNPFSLIYNWLFTNVMEIIYSILLINCLLFGKITFICEVILNHFENVINFLNQTSFELIFKKPSWFFIIIFYMSLCFIIYQDQLSLSIKKPMLVTTLILLGLYNSIYFQFYSRVTMINVSQGDCFLVQLPFNQGNYMIDTGGSIYTDYATTRIIPYLKYIGVKSLDALILTHDDFDHVGASESLINSFNVKKVITMKEDVGPLQSLDLYIPSIDKNDNSLTYLLNLNGLSYLFTGDLGIEGEKQIIEKYPEMKFDVLKVGHHGSETSTSNELLNYYRPKTALISVGKNNIYKHPSSTIIDRLNAYGITIYRSDLHGMVEIRSYFNSFHQVVTSKI